MAKATNLLSAFIAIFCLMIHLFSKDNVINLKPTFGLKPLALFATATTVSPSLVGEWEYSFPFYSSELTINKDSTFRFHERGCMGHGYSEGKWTFSANRLTLLSDEKYKIDNQLESYGIESDSGASNRKSKMSKRKPDLKFDLSTYTIKAIYKHVDTANVYFDRVQFILEQGTLYRLNKNGLRTEAKFTLSKIHYL